MKKLSLYTLVLLVFISCGKTGSSDSYLKVLSVTPTSSQKDINIADPITIKFNEKIKEVSITLINTDALSGKVTGDTKIEDDKVIFTPSSDLDYSTYKVNIDKVGTISSNNKKLKESYSYTFTTSPKKVDTIPTIPNDEEKEEEKEEKKEEDKTNKSDTSDILGLPENKDGVRTCDLVPATNCN